MTIAITKMKLNNKLIDDATLLTCRVNAIKDHLYSELKDEGVILSLKNGKYYGLNEVGRSIWQTIQTPVTVADIKEAIMTEYEIDETACVKEVVTFLKVMGKEDLVEFQDEKD